MDNHAIKAPGALHVEALEISSEGLKSPLSSWDFTPDQLRRNWKSGLMSNGYQMAMPWKNWPTSDRIRVIARFTLADGRAFEAEKDVTIRATAVAKRKPHPTPGEASGPASEITLPPPRKAELPDPASRSEAPLPKESVVEAAGHVAARQEADGLE